MASKENKVFVCGGGHQGLSMAGHLALNGVKVKLWNRTAEHISDVIATNEIHCDGVIKGVAKIEKASSNMAEVISDFIMVTTPSSAHKSVARELAPYVNEKMIIVLNPGRTFGAIEFAMELKKCGIKKLPHIAETQTIVYTCRRGVRNNTTILALKEDVKIASLKNSDNEYILENIPECLKKHFVIAESILETSFSNVGMVLHCAPVLMNAGWIETEKVDFKYYYDGISKSVAGLLEKIDQERLKVADALNSSVESVEKWLKRTYQVSGNGLYECIRNNEAYKEIDAPSTLQCRYIMEDVPNGLVPVEFLGKELGVNTENISTILDLACAVMNIDFRETGRKFSSEILKEYI